MSSPSNFAHLLALTKSSGALSALAWLIGILSFLWTFCIGYCYILLHIISNIYQHNQKTKTYINEYMNAAFLLRPPMSNCMDSPFVARSRFALRPQLHWAVKLQCALWGSESMLLLGNLFKESTDHERPFINHKISHAKTNKSWNPSRKVKVRVRLELNWRCWASVPSSQTRPVVSHRRSGLCGASTQPMWGRRMMKAGNCCRS